MLRRRALLFRILRKHLNQRSQRSRPLAHLQALSTLAVLRLTPKLIDLVNVSCISWVETQVRRHNYLSLLELELDENRLG